jgi:hypothetical protein
VIDESGEDYLFPARLFYTDADIHGVLAEKWLDENRSFPGLVWWPRRHYTRMSASDILERFEVLARQDSPFGLYPVVCIKPGR